MTTQTAAAASAVPAGWRDAERAARESYGRLVALLAYRWRDLAAAEDALGDAFAAALQHWPKTGVPAAPEAWLMTAAQRRLLQAARHARVVHDPAVLALFDADAAAPATADVPDERLKLLFVCAHPAVPEGVRAPLMLQAVLGLDAATIASAFLVSPTAMAQRLVRAKTIIRNAGIRYDEPEARQLPERLAVVLESIYGAYTIGSNVAYESAQPAARQELAAEALYLCRLVVGLQSDSAEALGLLSLMLQCEARRPAQFSAAGRFVPLAAQDTALWRRDLHDEADACLWRASGLRQPGPFQLEAAIHSAHSHRLHSGRIPWRAIAHLYGLLGAHFPSIGATVGHAVALAECGDVADALATLDQLPAAATHNYLAYWVARARLQRLAGKAEAADEALRRAIGLTEDLRVREHLLGQLDRMDDLDNRDHLGHRSR